MKRAKKSHRSANHRRWDTASQPAVDTLPTLCFSKGLIPLVFKEWQNVGFEVRRKLLSDLISALMSDSIKVLGSKIKLMLLHCS